MVETEKNEQGFIYAYVEWWLVNQKGEIDKDGEYIFVSDIWIHQDYRRNGTIRRFIHKVAVKYPQSKYMYYGREKHPDRLEIYSRNQVKEEYNGLR